MSAKSSSKKEPLKVRFSMLEYGALCSAVGYLVAKTNRQDPDVGRILSLKGRMEAEMIVNNKAEL